MALSRTFTRAWYEWVQFTPPTQNFRLNRAHALTYDIELALDHTCSYVHSLGNRLIEGKACDFVKLASNELEELNKIRSQVEALKIDEANRETIRNYIVATQRLLDEIKTADWTIDS